MGLFDKMKEPVFLKESSDAQRQLEVLRALESKLTQEGREKLRQDIRYLEYGIQGENQIAFELKNSHMPMYILHDIYLEDGELSAQIDYLVFTKKLCFVIECKNLYGNIEINNNGDFIRTMEFNGRKKKEGIYSPITQNERHLELMKKMKTETRTNLFSKFMTSRYFDDFYRTVVVLSNSKTVLNAKYAKKDIKQKVIRADQLVSFIKEQYKLSKEVENSDADMKTWAESYLKLHKAVEKDYTKKYEPYVIQNTAAEMDGPVLEPPAGSAEETSMMEEKTIEGTRLYQELKAYRLRKSREEKIKPYYIYNDSQLKDLIMKMPVDKQALQKVSGFGPVKAEKYGDDILKIIAECRER
ncbi:HRDC domain-containing protein [Clostridium sp. AN503]|uniref:HRDC domain-containing protein n=1 Tax=Clostridium sp. AN503 TaxID=3160598 RepID=UPI00345818EE